MTLCGYYCLAFLYKFSQSFPAKNFSYIFSERRHVDLARFVSWRHYDDWKSVVWTAIAGNSEPFQLRFFFPHLSVLSSLQSPNP